MATSLISSCEPPGDGSSLISTSSSSPSSFASSFNESISEPLTDNGGKHANSPQLPPPDSSGGGELVEAIDFPGLNTEAEPVNTTVDVDVSTKLSKLPTPSKKLTNCSTLTRSVSFSNVRGMTFSGLYYSSLLLLTAC